MSFVLVFASIYCISFREHAYLVWLGNAGSTVSFCLSQMCRGAKGRKLSIGNVRPPDPRLALKD